MGRNQVKSKAIPPLPVLPNPEPAQSTSRSQATTDAPVSWPWSWFPISLGSTKKKGRRKETSHLSSALASIGAPRVYSAAPGTPVSHLRQHSLEHGSMTNNFPSQHVRDLAESSTQDPPAYPSSSQHKAFLSTIPDGSYSNSIDVNEKLRAHHSPEVADPSAAQESDLYDVDNRIARLLAKIGAIEDELIFKSEAHLRDVFCDRCLGDKLIPLDDLELEAWEAVMLQDLLELVRSNPSSGRLHIDRAVLQMSILSRTYLEKALITDIEVTHTTLAGGGEADIFEGRWKGKIVAVRALRVFQKPLEKDRKTVRIASSRQALIWRHLSHPNILPLHGVYDGVERGLLMVSPWMEEGNALLYLENRGGDIFNLILSILLGVVDALIYIHSLHLNHGDVKPENVLVEIRDGKPTARLCDFGLTSPSASCVIEASARPTGGSVRCMAPEIFASDNAMMGLTYASDIYALGMTIWLLYDPNHPFRSKNEYVLPEMIKNGKRPTRRRLEKAPKQSEPLWDIMEGCWKPQPEDRRPLVQVREQLLALGSV